MLVVIEHVLNVVVAVGFAAVFQAWEKKEADAKRELEEAEQRWEVVGLASVSVAQAQGKRPYQEDRGVCVCPVFRGSRPSALFAIFDGHAGHRMAEFAALHIRSELEEQKDLHSRTKIAMERCFKKLESDFWAESNYAHDGSTATVVLLRGGCLKVAWVADSELWIVRRDGTAHMLTRNHNAKDISERLRVWASGATLIGRRVLKPRGKGVVQGASLAVTRSLGDVGYVKVGVSSKPDYAEYDLDGSEVFFVLGSDGVWDLIPDKTQLLSLMCEYLLDEAYQGDAADYLLEKAQVQFETKMCDNATVVVGFFDQRRPNEEDDTSSPKRSRQASRMTFRAETLASLSKAFNGIE